MKIQYADFAAWQREWLRGETLEAQLAYWTRRLADLPVLKLPADYAPPPAPSPRGARRTLTLPRELSASVKELSRRQGATQFMTLLAAFLSLLHRYTGQEDLVVASPVAGRDRVEVEGLIGFFVNTLVLRADLSGDPTFEELLARVREMVLDAHMHRDVPFEKLVEALRPERTVGQSPLFRAVFVMQHAPARALELPGLTLTPLQVERGTAKVDLWVGCVDDGQSLSLIAEYNAELFADATVAQMMRGLANLLEGAVADPRQRLSALPLVSPAELEGLEPSDFPEAELTERDLEALVLELGKVRDAESD